MKISETIAVLVIVAVMSLVGNLVGFHNGIIESLPGMIFLLALCVAGVIMRNVVPGNIPSVAWIVLIGCIVTYPGFPGSAQLSAWVGKVSFLSLTTPILAYAGLSIGKDLDMLKKTGWRIVVVAIFVFVGTYIGSALIAQGVLSATGQL
ncbi:MULTISPECIES: DUF340 domain-containing protein [Dethiosulfovibrio]|jgi:hypothetical protein|uniref:DUF340 domain-containing protein n=2 Tax=Dethiosulfovibrio TaxID=47054 RepID=A0ABS9EP67_9BACT|nr:MULTISPECIES: DUF340 domain-containing protein [Dethiosulfovibrio]MCF4114349.1 DUF340 domain-containing protein [Dethiosulfovibrio russensis]MCF4142990.1 DUF340 domain-containing protein [Dethiosulfovibrio marinus]MCF4145087.1 DUF340 domain-containing protein [Dethiosulfovibrio acidaminovorans]MEA3284279.1 DUF340 domain-containing protein [Synergistota bacterium]